MEPTERWTPQTASDLYDVASWGKGYFSVGENGCVRVHPEKDPARWIDLKQLVDTLVLRGINLPILVRFADILKHRLGEIHSAFQTAIAEHKYQGGYCCVYPIKVNQQRQVVEEVLEFGRPFRFGLEAGSKPELMAVMAMADNETPIICNGFKDDEYIEMAMLAQKVGRKIIPVVEKYTELHLILKYSARVGVRPMIGLRVKLASRGSGRWKSSGGYRSKFGLSAMEAMRALQGLKYLDVGGGLGIDYDGSQTDFESSVNYTLQEYANDIIYHVQNVCDEVEVPHPTIITESGRAIAAYHSVLVFNVLGVAGMGETDVPAEPPADAEQPLIDLAETLRGLTAKNVLESYHDAQQALDQALNLFSLGYLSLEQRCIAENLYWAITRKIQKQAKDMDYFPEELEGIDAMLSDTYFCNFSLFQSMPDSWAIKQLFPIMPIHRLELEPTRPAVLGDITCDSDGKVDAFIDRRDVKRTLQLHPFSGEDYYLGAFLLGAYQEILGDLHNLFGDTNAVHVRMSENCETILDSVIKGDTVNEVLKYVQFNSEFLVTQLRRDVEAALREGKVTYEESGALLKFYEEGLHGYTYLEDVHEQ